MLRFAILVSWLALTVANLAAPIQPWGPPTASPSFSPPFWGPPSYGPQQGGPAKRCITDAEAQQISDNFFIITGGQGIFNRTVAEAALAANFSDSSESVASIVNEGGNGPIAPLGTTITNEEAFIAANEEQPKTEFVALNLYHTCDVVIQRFEVTNLKPTPPRGISIFECVEAPAGKIFPWQIKQVYGEMNSLAWLIDLGIYNATGKTLGSGQ